MVEFKKEIERLTQRIAAERQHIRSQARRQAPQRNAQNILVAQRRGQLPEKFAVQEEIDSRHKRDRHRGYKH